MNNNVSTDNKGKKNEVNLKANAIIALLCSVVSWIVFWWLSIASLIIAINVMTTMKKTHKKDTVALILSILALIISVIGLVIYCMSFVK